MRGAALAIMLALAGCAAAPPPAPLAVGEPAAAKPRLWYVGLGLFDESWSENDVAALPAELARGASGFQLVPVVLSSRHGPVEPGAIRSLLSEIGAAARPKDVVLVYASTHGAPGLLGRSAGDYELEPVSAGQLRDWLAPLGDVDTVLILSACFSGSFIPALKGPHRIIFAAARADRTSFGCQAGAIHTVFGEALIRALARPAESLRDVVAATRASVGRRERAMHVDLPSQPALSVGASVRGLFDAPVF